MAEFKHIPISPRISMKISIHDVKHHALALSTISFEADHIGHIKALEDIPPKKSALLSHAQCLEYLAVSLGYNTYKGLFLEM